MRLAAILCLLLLVISWNSVPEDTPVIYLIGDSTCAIKSDDAFPEMGWGVPFITFFNDSIRVENHAVNGRSTKSFKEEGRWDRIKGTLKAGDWVFIQFGHNDEVPSKVGRYTTPDEFQDNLMQYVKETRAVGANPVLLTPVTRRSFENGVLVDTHEQYARLVRDVAVDLNVPLIDMTKKSMGLVNQFGEEKSVLLYHHLATGEHPNYPNGKEDNTHFNELGARKMAQLVLDGIEELELGLNLYVVKGTR
ncbi:rhamnogalacturonan acetylesterase [Marinoscillum sp.]|uniref:rhamnogalacturonan acetylesterase n=1 Tax=Marinoscillum sp. TaxID=2024838 RepID=UPI003BABE1DC